MKTRLGQGQKKILLVDDQLLTRISVARLLQHYSLDTIGVGTGESALAHFNIRQRVAPFFDLCIFDISLPDMSGLLLLRIVKEVSPCTPVIIITGDCVDQATQAAIEAATASLIVKPFEASSFIDRVLTVLQDPTFPSSLSPPPSTSAGRGERQSHRRPCRQTVDFRYNHVTASRETGAGRVVKQDLQGETIDISDEGIGLLTSFPLHKNHAVIFPHGSAGRTGVIKWSTQTQAETYHVGLKFL